jgi:hypothetical protein
MIDVAEIIKTLKPNSEFTVHGNSFEGLIWHDDSTPPPTKEEFEKALKNREWFNYKLKRQAEYPSLGEQLDALWKGGFSAEEMKRKIEAVKKKYPKPAE